MYEIGKITREWLQSTFFMSIPKKHEKMTCNDFRLITPMRDDAFKIFLRIIEKRIYKKVEMYVGEM